MDELEQIALDAKDPIKPFGQIDTLLFYSLTARKLRKFLAGKELAAKNWMPAGIPYLIKRGSKEPPLFVDELADGVDAKFLSEKRKYHLNEVEARLSPLQKKIWNYFLPRKLNDFFYATNGEAPGKPIERLFIDLDRGEGVSSEDAQEVVKHFFDMIEESAELKEVVGYKPSSLISWTGSSFHIYLFFKKPIPNSFYLEHFKCESKKKEVEPLTLAERWIEKLKKSTKAKVAGGHEKIKGTLTIDPSQTPSGKLCRVPLGSLHMKTAKEIDGVSLPLKSEMLEEKDLVKQLNQYTPKKFLEEIDELAKRLPKEFI
ncbi:hypothetical protein HY991_05470 [Candidatus Micrarchaeota archaeon]|nr:hypothetical protein [Candidatus Micrarchaeota archaeon]